jgi:hypothetical protein
MIKSGSACNRGGEYKKSKQNFSQKTVGEEAIYMTEHYNKKSKKKKTENQEVQLWCGLG